MDSWVVNLDSLYEQICLTELRDFTPEEELKVGNVINAFADITGIIRTGNLCTDLSIFLKEMSMRGLSEIDIVKTLKAFGWTELELHRVDTLSTDYRRLKQFIDKKLRVRKKRESVFKGAIWVLIMFIVLGPMLLRPTTQPRFPPNITEKVVFVDGARIVLEDKPHPWDREISEPRRLTSLHLGFRFLHRRFEAKVSKGEAMSHEEALELLAIMDRKSFLWYEAFAVDELELSYPNEYNVQLRDKIRHLMDYVLTNWKHTCSDCEHGKFDEKHSNLKIRLGKWLAANYSIRLGRPKN
jgi:hypothetical protein